MIVVAILAVLALSAVLGGIVFFLLWNEFVVQHLAGAHHVSYGASMLVALAIITLTQSSNADR